MAPILPGHVTILGLGLIGGSLALALARRGAVSVQSWSPSLGTRAQARAAGLVVADELDDALHLPADGLVVLAAPLPAFPELLQHINTCCPHIAVTDVGSVKAAVSAAVRAHAPQTRFIGGHPMAGTEQSGFAAARPDLFETARWVLTVSAETDLDLWSQVAQMALSIGAYVVPTTDDEHDAAVAAVSHLPHLLALTLAQVASETGPLGASLAAGSLRDGTRVAASPPELIRAICENNRQALLPVCDRALEVLAAARTQLATTGSVAALTAAGQAAKMALTSSPGTAVSLESPLDHQQLLRLGRDGNYVAELR